MPATIKEDPPFIEYSYPEIGIKKTRQYPDTYQMYTEPLPATHDNKKVLVLGLAATSVHVSRKKWKKEKDKYQPDEFKTDVIGAEVIIFNGKNIIGIDASQIEFTGSLHLHLKD